MANSEIKAAFRTFYREKSYAIINLMGLSLAIACCLVLGLYLKSELTYDKYNKRHNEIFRVVNEYITNGNAASYAVTPVPLGPMLKENYPEVRDYIRFNPLGRVLIRSGEKAIYWDTVYATDESVFDIFTHKILQGDPQTALKDPSAAAVSETFATRYFGDTNPIGKTIYAETAPEIPRKITLVFKDLPENTHLKYDVLFRFDGLQAGQNERWNLFNIGLFTYLVLPENYNVYDFKAISAGFYDRFMADLGKQVGQTWDCWLQPLTDIHLHSDIQADLPGGNLYYVYGFAAVACVIMLLACINYVNLAIARAAKRTKEIGMRKILGIPRPLLIFRFIGEAVIFSLMATLIGAAIVELVLKLTPINELLGKSLTLGLRGDPALLLWMLALSLAVGLLSGSYPAFYLSSMSPMSALAGFQGKSFGGFRLREALVLTQFTLAVVVISCTLIMAMQMRYVSRKPLGFDKHNRVVIQLRGADLIEKYPVLKNDLLKDSRIKGVSVSQNVIGMESYSMLNSLVDSESGPPGRAILGNMPVAEDFVEVMGMKLVEGRTFSKRLITDVGTTLVVNEALVKHMGWKNPLGKRIQLGSNFISGKVIGVIQDFHARSLHSPVDPFVLYPFNDNFRLVPASLRSAIQRSCVVNISGRDVRQTLEFLQEKFSRYDPKHPFEYKFLDDMLSEMYLSEERLTKMIGIFSGICIFISCMGLFGLAAFTTEQRSKEIGIRKAMGASTSQIIMMLSRKILLLVLVGAVVACLIAYYAIEEWLAGFSYRVGINPAVFILSTFVALAVAFITVALQSYRTAQANPALMMRYE